MAKPNRGDRRSAKARGLRLLEFSADWCGPCKLMKPRLAKFKEAHPLVDVQIIDVDGATGAKIADRLSVMNLPCVVVVQVGRGGKWRALARETGLLTIKELVSLWEKAERAAS